MAGSSDALIVVPTYNEADNIRRLLEAVVAAVPEASVLVVDDGSPDGTASIVERVAARNAHVHLMMREAKAGLARAYVSGFRWGMERGFDRFVEMDADFSHDPAALPGLLDAARRHDVAIGSRYIPGGGVAGWSRGRHVLSLGGNLYARLALGFGVRDSTSGFRCYRRRVLEAIGLDEVQTEGYAFQIDMTYRAWRRGFDIGEVPIVFRERTHGRSKMSRAIVLEAIVALTRWGLRDLLLGRRRPAGARRRQP